MTIGPSIAVGEARPTRRITWRRVLVLAAALVAVALIGSAIGAIVWLKHYSPLSFQGGGFGPDARDPGSVVRPDGVSGGKTVFYPRLGRGRVYHAAFDVTNTGPLDVTILGIAHVGYPVDFAAVDLRVNRKPNDETFDASVAAGHPTIRSHRFRHLVIGFRAEPCRFSNGDAVVSSDRLPLRIRYAHFFTRTVQVEMPFVIALSCNGKYPKSTWPNDPFAG